MGVEIGIDTQGFPLSPGTVDFTSPVHTHAPKGVFAMLSDANDAAGTPDNDVRMAIGECFVDYLKGVSAKDFSLVWGLCDAETLILQRFIEANVKMNSLKPLEDEYLPDDGLIPSSEPKNG